MFAMISEWGRSFNNLFIMLFKRSCIYFLHFLQAEVLYAEEKSKTREFSEEKKCNKVSDEKIISGMNVKI